MSDAKDGLLAELDGEVPDPPEPADLGELRAAREERLQAKRRAFAMAVQDQEAESSALEKTGLTGPTRKPPRRNGSVQPGDFSFTEHKRTPQQDAIMRQAAIANAYKMGGERGAQTGMQLGLVIGVGVGVTTMALAWYLWPSSKAVVRVAK